MGVEEVGDGAMSFVRWKPTVKDRVQGPSHQLSPKLSSISSRPPLCCFHLWLSVSAYNDTLSSACGDNVISSTSRAKAFFSGYRPCEVRQFKCGEFWYRARLSIILLRQSALLEL